MSGTVSEAIEDAKEIEVIIANILSEYEKKHGVFIQNIALWRSVFIGGTVATTSPNVEIQVCLK